eukprot:355791-Chlamydomonas_euryale.AAC.7
MKVWYEASFTLVWACAQLAFAHPRSRLSASPSLQTHATPSARRVDMEAPQVQIDTPMGSITVELYYKHAPKTVKNFTELAKRGYYDGTIVGDARGGHPACQAQ